MLITKPLGAAFPRSYHWSFGLHFILVLGNSCFPAQNQCPVKLIFRKYRNIEMIKHWKKIMRRKNV